MKRLSLLFLALVLAGCAHVHEECSVDGSTTTAAIGGNTVGTTLLATGLTAAKAGGFLGAQRASAPAATPSAGTYVDYNYLAVWGPDYVTLACNMPQPVAPPQLIQVPNGSHVESVK